MFKLGICGYLLLTCNALIDPYHVNQMHANCDLNHNKNILQHMYGISYH